MIYLFDNICVFLIYATIQKYDFFLCFSLLVFYDCIYLNNNTVKMFYCEVLYQYKLNIFSNVINDGKLNFQQPYSFLQCHFNISVKNSLYCCLMFLWKPWYFFQDLLMKKRIVYLK